jgi:hypothetical protein
VSGIQTLLIIVVVSLTLLLIIVGIQVILIMLDLRRGVKRLNSILDDAVLGGGLIRPEKLTGILEMFRKGKNRQTKEQGQV